MDVQDPQPAQPQANEEEQDRLGKVETPPPTYEDACQFILTGQHPSSQSTRVSIEPPPAYPADNYTLEASNLDHTSHYVNLPLDQPDSQNHDAQDTMVIASSADFPRTCSLCKKIAAYLVAIFWISISCIQLLMGVGVAHHYHFEKFLYGGSNRAYGNAMFMFWMMTLFANIVLLFGIINKNR